MKTDEFKKIITFAISNEIEAYDFYKGVADKSKDAGLKKIFAELADEEAKHRKFLEGLTSGKTQMHFDETKDYKVAESLEKPKLSLSMKPSDAIALAVKNEQEAMDMYTEMANCSTDAEQKKMFQSLAAMERGHKVKLEDTFTNMAFPEAW
ncbi:MAG TPA: ferritin family protein [Smithella sp.]|nr:ferritin family protein [Smithella sp.]MDM7988146.1 ferritin family protein [Smithella sp.]HNY51516.1 ferritin family protein [Smithella sp.]HOG90668.1 ferritin family protein [Smithella sp.]HOU51594.1 ferritin family protein [Smithella sp.]